MKARVLVVDDEPSILFTFQAILDRNGFEVETAASAQEAIQKLQAGTFQVVISDLRMETNLAGQDVIRCAKRQAHAPVAVLHTAYAVPESEWKSWGADAMFEKPVASVAAVARELHSLLRRQAGQKPPD